MKNIHLIPTDKPSRLVFEQKAFIRPLILKSENIGLTKDSLGQLIHEPQHIYITSDEALPYDSSIFDNGAFYHRDAAGDVHIITKHTFKPNPRFCKRIILTTDQDLIANGVQAIDDDFLEWFVKNPSCEEVDIDYDLIITQDKPLIQHQGSKPIVVPHRISYKIIIPKEEPNPHILSCCRTKEECYCGKYSKQEALEEAADKWSLEKAQEFAINKFKSKHKKGIVTLELILEILKVGILTGHKFGAKWQQERMYSENDLKKSI